MEPNGVICGAEVQYFDGPRVLSSGLNLSKFGFREVASFGPVGGQLYRVGLEWAR